MSVLNTEWEESMPNKPYSDTIIIAESGDVFTDRPMRVTLPVDDKKYISIKLDVPQNQSKQYESLYREP